MPRYQGAVRVARRDPEVQLTISSSILIDRVPFRIGNWRPHGRDQGCTVFMSNHLIREPEPQAGGITSLPILALLREDEKLALGCFFLTRKHNAEIRCGRYGPQAPPDVG